MNRTRILLADDHTVLIDALVNFLANQFDIVGIARDGRTLIAMAKQDRPDVIVTDISMPDLNGTNPARILRKEAGLPKLLLPVWQSSRAIRKTHFAPAALG